MKQFWKRFKRTADNQKGVSLVEVALYIAVAGVILGGVASVYITTSGGNNVQEEVKNVNVIRSAVKKLYATSSNYTGLSNTKADNAGVFPAKMKKGTSVKNAWNGDVTLAVDSGDSTRFTVTYAAVPKAECIQFSTYDPTSWVSIKVGTNAITDVDTANTACSAATNTVVLTGS